MSRDCSALRRGTCHSRVFAMYARSLRPRSGRGLETSSRVDAKGGTEWTDSAAPSELGAQRTGLPSELSPAARATAMDEMLLSLTRRSRHGTIAGEPGAEAADRAAVVLHRWATDAGREEGTQRLE